MIHLITTQIKSIGYNLHKVKSEVDLNTIIITPSPITFRIPDPKLNPELTRLLDKLTMAYRKRKIKVRINYDQSIFVIKPVIKTKTDEQIEKLQNRLEELQSYINANANISSEGDTHSHKIYVQAIDRIQNRIEKLKQAQREKYEQKLNNIRDDNY